MTPVVIGDCILHLGDCLEIFQMLPTCLTIDCVMTDPPYGIGFDYEGYEDSEENLNDLICALMKFSTSQAKRTVITCGNTNITNYPKADWYGCWTFDTTSSRGKLGWSQWQPILFYGEDVSKGTKNFCEVLKSDRIHCSVRPDQIAESKTFGHPCSKPLEFMRRMVGRFSRDGETILDPFMGSGTTGVAAVQMGRKFIGIEREPKYFDIACKRIEQAYAQPDFFVETKKPQAVQEALL